MYCSDAITSESFINIVDKFADSNKIRILPFMFAADGSMKVMCPCCLLDRRTDNEDFIKLKAKDRWSYCFVKQKFRKHKMAVDESSAFIEPGFHLRPVNEATRRTKYDNIDMPIFKELGFKGHKFDKNIFFPLAVCRVEDRIRVGILNPELMSNWPILQRVFSSWIFKLNDVPPVDFPDILPISGIGSLTFSDNVAPRNVPSLNKPVEVSNFFMVLNRRADKRSLKKVSKGDANLSEMKGCSQQPDDAGGTYDMAVEC